MYDYLIITNQPAFYKINLYNEISKKIKIKVIYLGKGSNIRNKDFISGNMNFEHVFLSEKNFEERNKIKCSLNVIKIIKETNYKKVLISGWDEIENWVSAIYSTKSKNSVVVESSIYESKINGLKGFIKKKFLNKISSAYVSGEDQKKLLNALGFKGEIIKTYGVGLMNFNLTKKHHRKPFNNKYLYVGRLSSEKNIELLIEVFNELGYSLGVVGSGPQEKKLKEAARDNIMFYGYIKNEELREIYSEYDVFVLPSLSEAWGLVIEEALYNGLPVLISDRVGCRSEIVEKYQLGKVIELGDKDYFKKSILDYNFNYYKKNVEAFKMENLKKMQINSYLKVSK